MYQTDMAVSVCYPSLPFSLLFSLSFLFSLSLSQSECLSTRALGCKSLAPYPSLFWRHHSSLCYFPVLLKVSNLALYLQCLQCLSHSKCSVHLLNKWIIFELSIFNEQQYYVKWLYYMLSQVYWGTINKDNCISWKYTTWWLGICIHSETIPSVK